ncbi:MAG: divalent-cation tolerance protein CutA [Parachlamydiales bacterium]
MIVVFWTCGNIEEARRVGRLLVEQHLVACVNIIPEIESLYWWEGKVASDKEVKVLLKTTRERFKAVRELIQREASYDLPEITFIELTGGSKEYLDWVRAATR